MTIDDVMETAEGFAKTRNGDYAGIDAARAALRAAIEQYAAEQRGSGEPVAWHTESRDVFGKWWYSDDKANFPDAQPLYTAPPKREPLTDEQIRSICYASGWDDSYQSLRFARAIERAHGISAERLP